MKQFGAAISQRLDVRYLVKFLLLFFFLYYFDWGYLGLTSKEGSFYFPFLSEYANYTQFLTKAILRFSELIARLFGLNTVIENGNILRVPNGVAVWMQRPCIGLVIVFFWWAFVLSHASTWRKKLLWCAVGALAIFIVNSCRVTILLFALKNSWPNYTPLNHHDLFKYTAYLLIFLMIVLYNRSEKQELSKSKSYVLSD